MEAITEKETVLTAIAIFAALFTAIFAVAMTYRVRVKEKELQLAMKEAEDAARNKELVSRLEESQAALNAARDSLTREEAASRHMQIQSYETRLAESSKQLEEFKQAESRRMDQFRAHLEHQLRELNERFASTNLRWNELNHLVVSGQLEQDSPRRTLRIAPSKFLRAHGIDPKEVKVQPDLVFVLTPFEKSMDGPFKAVVDIGQRLNLRVNRGDEYAPKGDIFPQLLGYIVQARVIVANISGRNPNVFYELGIAHALDKPVVLIAHKESEIPFDVQSKMVIFYRENEDLQAPLTEALARLGLSNDGEASLPYLEPVTMSEVSTKLDLARAYMDMGDPEGARSILNEVVAEASAEDLPLLKQSAEQLIGVIDK
jgi:FimV-like protein